MGFPKHVVLKSMYNNKYLRCIDEAGKQQGFLQFSGDDAASVDSRFEIITTSSGLIHLKCCSNNKYWQRSSPTQWWIRCGPAASPVKTQSNWSCTLFEPVPVDGLDGAFRFRHVELKQYAGSFNSGPPFGDCLYAGSEDPNEEDLRDVFVVIDATSSKKPPRKNVTTTLPSFVAIKSRYNHKYVRYRGGRGDEQEGFLQVSEENPAAIGGYAKFEVVRAKNDGELVHLKCCSNSKYWRSSSEGRWWVSGSAAKPKENSSDWACTLFKPVYVDGGGGDGTSVRLLHVQLGRYACLFRSDSAFGGCLYAASDDPSPDMADVFTFVDWESFESNEEEEDYDGGDSGEEEEENVAPPKRPPPSSKGSHSSGKGTGEEKPNNPGGQTDREQKSRPPRRTPSGPFEPKEDDSDGGDSEEEENVAPPKRPAPSSKGSHSSGKGTREEKPPKPGGQTDREQKSRPPRGTQSGRFEPKEEDSDGGDAGEEENVAPPKRPPPSSKGSHSSGKGTREEKPSKPGGEREREPKSGPPRGTPSNRFEPKEENSDGGDAGEEENVDPPKRPAPPNKGSQSNKKRFSEEKPTKPRRQREREQKKSGPRGARSDPVGDTEEGDPKAVSDGEDRDGPTPQERRREDKEVRGEYGSDGEDGRSNPNRQKWKEGSEAEQRQGITKAKGSYEMEFTMVPPANELWGALFASMETIPPAVPDWYSSIKEVKGNGFTEHSIRKIDFVREEPMYNGCVVKWKCEYTNSRDLNLKAMHILVLATFRNLELELLSSASRQQR
ncbi:unnamed protein product [Linum tenue]|uniref:Agglutinin domain-containing protein n=1 Tax=Linum tenue TaxID=586396 RepID=A0AAV0L3G4_9ROSI|nr:unnamed protein product [Linum tenue]